MISTILKKDLNRLFHTRLKGIKKNWLNLIINLTIGVGLFAFIIFLFIRLDSRFVSYGVSDKLLTLTLGIVTIIYSLIATIRIDKSIYDTNDLTLTLSLPIKPRDIVIAKSIGLYLNELISLGPVLIALFISFATVNSVTLSYIFISIASVVLLPVWVLFIGTILSIPYHFIRQFMANHNIVQLVLSLVIVILFSFAYSQVLDIFIGLINGDRLIYLFNDTNMRLLGSINRFLIPGNFIVDMIFAKNMVLNSLIFFWGSLILGVLSVLFLTIFYRRVRNYSMQLKQERRKKKYVVHSLKSALLLKEIRTLFRNSNYLLIYCTLLLSLGFVNYAVSSSLYSLVVRFLGTGYTFYPFAFLILTVFAAVINSLGALLVSKEKENAVIMKYIPVGYRTQITIKYLVLILMAFVSYVIAGITLIVGGLLEPLAVVLLCSSSFFLTSVILTNIVNRDVKNPNFKSNISDDSKVNYSLLLSLLLPIIFAALSAFFYFIVGEVIMMLAIAALSLLLFILFYLNLMRSATKNMQRMEV